MESMTSNKEKNVSSQIQAAFAECEKKIKIAEQKAAETNQKLQVRLHPSSLDCRVGVYETKRQTFLTL